jgi:hypothetical protein
VRGEEAGLSLGLLLNGERHLKTGIRRNVLSG